MSSRTNLASSADQTPFERGYVHIYTGDGKGKTTAAIGLAVRAAGAGLRVFIGQFMKMGAYSEIKALQCFGEKIVCRQYGDGRWIAARPTEVEVELARQALEEIRGIITSEEYQVVVLDEIIMATWFGLLETQDLIDLIDSRPVHVELVLTGRRAGQELIDHADLVTEMCEVKHYYQNGVLARKGIES